MVWTWAHSPTSSSTTDAPACGTPSLNSWRNSRYSLLRLSSMHSQLRQLLGETRLPLSETRRPNTNSQRHSRSSWSLPSLLWQVADLACEAMKINLALVGKKLNLNELRLASPDLLKEFFSLDKDLWVFMLAWCCYCHAEFFTLVSPLALDTCTFPKVVTVLDISLISSSSLIVFHVVLTSSPCPEPTCNHIYELYKRKKPSCMK